MSLCLLPEPACVCRLCCYFLSGLWSHLVSLSCVTHERRDMSTMTEKILNLTLEIICLLTGEDYIVVKKSDHDSRGCRPRRPPRSSAPLHHLLPFSVSHNKNKKILGIANKIIDLLSGEEWEHSEEQEDPYMDSITDSQQPISSEGGSSERNPAESRGSVPCNQDCIEEEDSTGTKDHQMEDEHRSLQHKGDEPELDLISAVLSVSCDENPPNSSPAPRPSDCTATCSKFERYPADGPSSLTPSLVRTRSITVQEEERPSDCTASCPKFDRSAGSPNSSLVRTRSVTVQDKERLSEQQPKVAESVTERLRARYSYIPPSKRRKGNPVPLRKEANSPIPSTTCETDLTKDLDVIMNLEDATQTAYQCSHCQECFCSAADFITHQALHKAESWFPSFDHPASFVSMDFSGKQKPFVCLDCGKCFMYKSAFTRHQRIHTGERPFICSECGKSFSQNTHLAKHRKNH